MHVKKRTFAVHRKLGAELWRTVKPALAERLTDADDPTLWQLAITAILGRARADTLHYTGKDAIFIEIGCCASWIRPHWKTASGMTAPIGYNPTVFHDGGSAWSFRSLPAFDWSLKWQQDVVSGAMLQARGQPTRRPLTYRICVPARTGRHRQATVHTIWAPSSPDNSTRKWFSVYGFKRTNAKWRCFAQSEGEPGSRVE
jgi:hypothetical protein